MMEEPGETGGSECCIAGWLHLQSEKRFMDVDGK